MGEHWAVVGFTPRAKRNDLDEAVASYKTMNIMLRRRWTSRNRESVFSDSTLVPVQGCAKGHTTHDASLTV